ncbi:HNH endonuclease signature motif containing protein [Protaetiibacter larvae]|uniref:DUF222 domain-containing protein n=1 Tax=Protaetiibacter larvae TaxID=2592654 RepID=A0A5C1Y4Y2_9MICO|nr:HNH endonuclease signature motif containing protein [Protaetiibacter larvae]QEO08760.1 DUF222 domain-containing protein [Protaetiibacter larvae]
MPSIPALLATIGDTTTAVVLPVVGVLSDQELVDGQRLIAQVRRRLDAVAAAVAGEIAHRSRRELGHDGLAARRGQRSAEGLISQLTGGSTGEARRLVKAGELLPVDVSRPDASSDAAPVARWLQLIGDAVASAVISVDAAEVIRTRLTQAASDSDDMARLDALANAAETLVQAAPLLTLEQLATRAGRLRDELDLAGIAAREEQLRDKRSLRVSKQLDGMTRITGLLDPESAAVVVPILDAATSPRRGGPRFVNPEQVQRAEDLMRDQRTTEQLTLDTLVELVRIGSRVDDGRLLGDRTPAVRILVTKHDLELAHDADGHREGAAFFEGQDPAVSIQTAERFICAGGAIPILFDGDGKALNLGREQRLFTRKQRLVMAARDGGCLMCDRPPSWTEAHHINHWDQHHGRTDIDDGVLLCTFCHLKVHNSGWRITRQGSDYFLVHPDDDGIRRRTPLPSKSPAHDRLRAAC